MYSDKKQKHIWAVILAAVLVLGIGALVYSIAGGAGKSLNEESALAIREAVLRSASQCYVVEGVYPPDLEYLENNYGLQVNTEDFYVRYDAFASNLPPEVRVSVK